MVEYLYGKTPIGQLIYDLLFTKLSDRYLARKNRVPIADIRRGRKAAKRGLREGRKIAKAKGRKRE